jgi:hypothetical protein
MQGWSEGEYECTKAPEINNEESLNGTITLRRNEGED